MPLGNRTVFLFYFLLVFRLLHFNDILPMDESAAEEPISVPNKPDRFEQSRKKKKANKNSSETDSQNSTEYIDEKNDASNYSKSRSESPTDEYNVIDYNTLIPAIAMDCGSDTESKKEPPKQQAVLIKKILRNDKVSFIRFSLIIYEIVLEKGKVIRLQTVVSSNLS